MVEVVTVAPDSDPAGTSDEAARLALETLRRVCNRLEAPWPEFALREVDTVERRLAAAEAQRDAALKEALELATTLSRWLRHHSTCARVTEAGRCTCGLQEALAFIAPTMDAEARAALRAGGG